MDDSCIRDLRDQIRSYENKAADVKIEKLRQHINLEVKERELKRLKEEVDSVHSYTDEIFKRRGEVHEALTNLKTARSILELDTGYLGQALKLLQNEIRQRKDTLKTKMIQNRQCLLSLVTKAEVYQSFYDSLEIVKKIKELEKMEECSSSVASAAQEQKDHVDMRQETAENSTALQQELDGLDISHKRILSKLEEVEKEYNNLLLKCSGSLAETDYMDLLLKTSESLKGIDDVGHATLDSTKAETDYMDLLLKTSESLKGIDDVGHAKLDSTKDPQEDSDTKKEYMGISVKCSCGYSFRLDLQDI